MTIPTATQIRLPALQFLEKKNTSVKTRDFVEPLAKEFGLTPEEISEKYPSGNNLIFYARIAWALSHLHVAGLIKKPGRGMHEISEMGREKLMSMSSGAIHSFINGKLRERSQSSPPGKDDKKTDQESTPLEKLLVSLNQIKDAVYFEIIDTILGKTPREFEKLVVSLLQHMGYGGGVQESGEVTPFTNDKGIDGIIKEDVLGLGRIHIQAKRYASDNAVARAEIQKFVGALAGTQANKGIFITTSHYKKSAKEYVAQFNGPPTIVLIDGMQLAQYIYDFGVGMQVEQTLELKKLDGDFWDSMEEDKTPSQDQF